MYQTLVLGLGGLMLISTFYFVKKADTSDLLIGAFTKDSDAVVVQRPVTPESVSGTYVCDKRSGCENPKELTLSKDGQVVLTTSLENGVEVVKEVGTWAVGGDKAMQLTFTGTQTENYDSIRALFIKKIQKHALSKFLYDGALYPDLKNPTFKKES